ncbi:MAG TPA: DUF4249 family protein [Cyclobacteriaceae bacterium]|nr:DUF4249 family protein [Cyclobacteriaceae bacterium]
MIRILTILRWIVVFVALNACVEPIAFEVPPPQDIIVLDGSINDMPGPYQLKIFRGRSVQHDTTYHFPVQRATVTLHEDTGAEEAMLEGNPGEYSTRGIIQGKVGRSYHVTVQLPDGQILTSEPETILPPGEISAVRHEFEARTLHEAFGDVASDVFNIYIDSRGNAESKESSFVRWRLRGVYTVKTRPELHVTFLQVSAYMTPWPCSGFVVEPALGGGKLVQVAPCLCCDCWVRIFESTTRLSDTELVVDGEFRNVKVGEVPINRETFHDKFLAEVEQMPLSKTAYDYFKLIREQKEAPSNLFQPPMGRLRGNVNAQDPNYPVIGLFWATSITRSSIYLTKDDVPYELPAMDLIAEPCNVYFANSTTTKPGQWK